MNPVGGDEVTLLPLPARPLRYRAVLTVLDDTKLRLNLL